MVPLNILHDGLVRARALIETPKRWTKGAMARDSRRVAVAPTDEDAFAYDLLGAIFRAGYDLADIRVTNELRDVLTRVSGGRESDRLWLIEWHDAPSRKHHDVLALIDAALSTLTEPSNEPTGSLDEI